MLHDNCELVDVKFSDKSKTFGNHNFKFILIWKRFIFQMKMPTLTTRMFLYFIRKTMLLRTRLYLPLRKCWVNTGNY